MTENEFFSHHAIFTTRQFAFAMDMSLQSASRKLNKLGRENALKAVTRGVWAQIHHAQFSPSGLVPYLLRGEQGYISFLSALHIHGVISQIPNVIQVATTGHGRRLSTPVGHFEFFQIQPRLMREGIEAHSGKLQFNIATPEKALLDTIYLSTRKGRRFSHFPELDLARINKRKLRALIKNLPGSVKKLVSAKLQRPTIY